MDRVTCSRCIHLPGAGKQPKDWTRLGLYRCPNLPKWTFVSPFVVRDCKTFSPVAEADLPARVAFERHHAPQPLPSIAKVD